MAEETLGQRLRRLRTERTDMTMEEVAPLVNSTFSSIGKYERDEQVPPLDKLMALAKLYREPVNKLIALAKPYKDLLEELAFPADRAAELSGVYDVGKVVWLPVVGEVQAGLPKEVIQQVEESFPFDSQFLNGDAGSYFWVRVEGRSMVGAGIGPGDLVLVRRQPEVENRQIAVVQVTDEGAAIKRVHRTDGQVLLISENPEFPPQVHAAKDVRVVGLVRKVVRDVG